MGTLTGRSTSGSSSTEAGRAFTDHLSIDDVIVAVGAGRLRQVVGDPTAHATEPAVGTTGDRPEDDQAKEATDEDSNLSAIDPVEEVTRPQRRGDAEPEGKDRLEGTGPGHGLVEAEEGEGEQDEKSSALPRVLEQPVPQVRVVLQVVNDRDQADHGDDETDVTTHGILPSPRGKTSCLGLSQARLLPMVRSSTAAIEHVDCKRAAPL